MEFFGEKKSTRPIPFSGDVPWWKMKELLFELLAVGYEEVQKLPIRSLSWLLARDRLYWKHTAKFVSIRLTMIVVKFSALFPQISNWS